MSRNIFGCLSKFLVPAPIPTCFNTKSSGGRPCKVAAWSKVKARNKAAPVGVTSSPVTPGGPRQVGMPIINLRVAGAGTGNKPWSVHTMPSPMGNREMETLLTPKACKAMSVPTVSLGMVDEKGVRVFCLEKGGLLFFFSLTQSNPLPPLHESAPHQYPTLHEYVLRPLPIQ